MAIAMSTAFLSRVAVGIDVAISFVYCYCLKWQNQAVDIEVAEGFGFS